MQSISMSAPSGNAETQQLLDQVKNKIAYKSYFTLGKIINISKVDSCLSYIRKRAARLARIGLSKMDDTGSLLFTYRHAFGSSETAILPSYKD